MSGRQLGFRGQVRAVCRKELTDALRDRRSLMSALLYPVLMPLMITFMFGALARLEGSDRPLETPSYVQSREMHDAKWQTQQNQCHPYFQLDAAAIPHEKPVTCAKYPTVETEAVGQ